MFYLRRENLNQLLNQAKNLNQSFADKYNVIIHYEPVNEEVFVNVDADRFLQVITNLLSNAIKFLILIVL